MPVLMARALTGVTLRLTDSDALPGQVGVPLGGSCRTLGCASCGPGSRELVPLFLLGPS